MKEIAYPLWKNYRMGDKMKITLPEKVSFIIRTLQAAGYEAYAVGGCVRDSILGREPEDWDITTSASPQQVKALFRRTVDTGIRHGTVTVMLKRQGFEVTTYRIDGAYEDGRHPKEVTFISDLKEDLRRRDFTINAMAYNDEAGLVDEFGGIRDLERGMLRCVGEPRERFTEDALRMMRAVRFSAQLGLEIESGTKEAIRELAPNLRQVSAERIQAELVKLVISPHPEELRVAWDTGITGVILPELDEAMETPQRHPHHKYSVGEHTLCSMMAVAPDKVLRLTMLFHDLGKPAVRTTDEEGMDHFKGHAAVSERIAADVMNRLKFDNDTRDKVNKLVFYHDYYIAETPGGVRRAASKIGTELFPLLLKVKRADVAAQSGYMEEEKLRSLKKVERLYQEIREQEQALSLKDLAVTGRDLIDAGMRPGKEIGETLSRLLELVLEDPQRNTKEYLLSQL